MINQDKNNQGIDGEKDYIKVIENKFKCNFIVTAQALKK